MPTVKDWIMFILEAVLAVILAFFAAVFGLFTGFILIIMSLISDRMINDEDTYLR